MSTGDYWQVTASFKNGATMSLGIGPYEELDAEMEVERLFRPLSPDFIDVRNIPPPGQRSEEYHES